MKRIRAKNYQNIEFVLWNVVGEKLIDPMPSFLNFFFISMMQQLHATRTLLYDKAKCRVGKSLAKVYEM